MYKVAYYHVIICIKVIAGTASLMRVTFFVIAKAHHNCVLAVSAKPG